MDMRVVAVYGLPTPQGLRAGHVLLSSRSQVRFLPGTLWEGEAPLRLTLSEWSFVVGNDTPYCRSLLSFHGGRREYECELRGRSCAGGQIGDGHLGLSMTKAH